MLTAVNVPPITARLLVGSLCVCACTVPVFIGETEDATDVGVEGSGFSTSVELTSDGSDSNDGGATATWMTTSGNDGSLSDPATDSSSGFAEDMPSVEEPQCVLPEDTCDADGDDLERALGVGCGGFVTDGPMAIAGPSESRGVTAGLGAGTTFAPRFGARAVVLSTGVAAHAGMTLDAVMAASDCSKVGLPCPSTNFPEEFDLAELPAPLTTQSDCPEGQPPVGDCSGTVDVQWLGDPRLAHDYTELRFSAAVPQATLSVSLAVAFLTTERPQRFPTGYNDFLIVWLDSEHFTGNIAIHPEQHVAVSADELLYTFHGEDPELADFAFAGHAATNWFRISAPVTPGETITMVLALFDQGDGAVDSAVLLDDLRWDCDAVQQP